MRRPSTSGRCFPLFLVASVLVVAFVVGGMIRLFVAHDGGSGTGAEVNGFMDWTCDKIIESVITDSSPPGFSLPAASADSHAASQPGAADHVRRHDDVQKSGSRPASLTMPSVAAH